MIGLFVGRRGEIGFLGLLVMCELIDCVDVMCILGGEERRKGVGELGWFGILLLFEILLVSLMIEGNGVCLF